MPDEADNAEINFELGIDPICPLKIGFKEGCVSDRPERFDVIGSKFGEFLIFEKPPKVLSESYLGAPDGMPSVVKAIRENPDKPEFQRFGASSPFAVNQIDYECSGASIIAFGKERAAEMRNAMWSGLFTFEYLVLAMDLKAETPEEIECSLPIYKPENQSKWRVSHAFGKKSETKFLLLDKSGDWKLWKAATKAARPHQIRIHAAECGIGIASEKMYSKTPPPYLSKIKKGAYRPPKNSDEKPLYDDIAIHLALVKYDGKCAGLSGTLGAAAKLPKGFSAALKKLNLKYSFPLPKSETNTFTVLPAPSAKA